MLGFMPEDLLAMQGRYPAAIAEVFDSEAFLAEGQIGPGELRRNVFDFADGVRLIISRNEEAGRRYLLLSAGVRPGSESFQAIARGDWSPDVFGSIALERFRLISRDFGPMDFQGLTPTKLAMVWARRLEAA